MKTLTIIQAVLAGALFSGAALAGNDCTDPVANWQPPEVLRQKLEEHGWKIQRIKVDDGCYEVRGVDNNGNKFKAEYAPASLRIRKLEITFDQEGDATLYLDRNGKPAGTGKPAE